MHREMINARTSYMAIISGSRIVLTTSRCMRLLAFLAMSLKCPSLRCQLVFHLLVPVSRLSFVYLSDERYLHLINYDISSKKSYVAIRFRESVFENRYQENLSKTSRGSAIIRRDFFTLATCLRL